MELVLRINEYAMNLFTKQKQTHRGRKLRVTQGERWGMGVN